MIMGWWLVVEVMMMTMLMKEEEKDVAKHDGRDLVVVILLSLVGAAMT